MITPLGGGLNILIMADYTEKSNWMSFASWYSIQKNLPDAHVEIFCKRGLCKKQVFTWTHRCGVKLSFVKNKNEYFEITPDVMAVDFYKEDFLGPIDVKSDEEATFVSYANGCGKFSFNVFGNNCPFYEAGQLFSEDLRLNEYRVLKLWDKAFKAYISVI